MDCSPEHSSRGRPKSTLVDITSGPAPSCPCLESSLQLSSKKTSLAGVYIGQKIQTRPKIVFFFFSFFVCLFDPNLKTDGIAHVKD